MNSGHFPNVFSVYRPIVGLVVLCCARPTIGSFFLYIPSYRLPLIYKDKYEHILMIPLVSFVLLPILVLLHYILWHRKYSARLVEACAGEALAVETILALECSEANHVVAAPVLVNKLASTLVEDILQRWRASKLGSMHIRAYLIEQRLRSISICSICATQQSLSLGEDDVSQTEDRHVVALVALVHRILVGVGIELQRAVALTPSLAVGSTVDLLTRCLAVVLQTYTLGERELLAFVDVRLRGGSLKRFFCSSTLM